VGCRQSLSNDPFVVWCALSDRGFPFPDDSWAYPCHSAYHTPCFAAGPPFYTPHKDGSGLTFPRIQTWPNFICEACTVRSLLDRELTGVTDWKLMCFERMRVLDMAHCWSADTHSKYQGKLHAFAQFESEYDLRVLRPTPLLRPPDGAEISLMWMMESYSLHQSRLSRTDEFSPLLKATVRQLRPAMSQYIAWDTMVSQPSACFDKEKRLIYQACRPTDRVGCSLFASGIASRIGDNVTASVALLDRHVRFLMADLEDQYLSTRTPRARRRAVQGGLATLLLWLGWLRSSECFTLKWSDF
jgi:hypothetical protein